MFIKCTTRSSFMKACKGAKVCDRLKPAYANTVGADRALAHLLSVQSHSSHMYNTRACTHTSTRIEIAAYTHTHTRTHIHTHTFFSSLILSISLIGSHKRPMVGRETRRCTHAITTLIYRHATVFFSFILKYTSTCLI